MDSSTSPDVTPNSFVEKLDFSRSYTRQEYFKLPEGPPYHELIDGKLDQSPSSWLWHQLLVGVIIRRLLRFAEDELGGVLLYRCNLLLPGTEDVYHPDFLYLTPGRSRLAKRRWVEGTPDMVCEILSPGSERRDRHRKLPVYQQAQVPHLWLIEPEPPLTVEEYLLAPNGRYQLERLATAPAIWSPTIFPDWSLNLAEAQQEISLPDDLDEEEGSA